MRLLRNKWDELKCGRMNYWKESVFVVLLAVVVVVGLALRVTASQTDKGKSAQKITASGGKQTGAVKNVGDKNSTGDMPQTAGKSIQTAGQNNVVKPEDAVYTFLQGPKSWGKRLTWSGKWAETYYDGGKFGAFGCGFCCMANIYSTQIFISIPRGIRFTVVAVQLPGSIWKVLCRVLVLRYPCDANQHRIANFKR